MKNYLSTLTHRLLALAFAMGANISFSQAQSTFATLAPETGWERLEEMPSDDWESYYYVITDYTKPLMIQLGMAANNETKYNALWYQGEKDPMADKTVVWTMEKNVKSDGSKTYAILRNAAYDSYFLQTEMDKAYLFRTHDNGGGDKTWGRLEISATKNDDGSLKWFTIENGKYPSSGSTTYKGYLGPWNDVSGNACQAGYEMAANKLNTYVGHYLIYAMKKAKYDQLLADRIAQASSDNPAEVTAWLKDQSMELTAASAWKGLGTVSGDATNRNGECGVSKTFNVNQTLTGIPNGVYRVKAQGFYRAGSRSVAGAAHANGSEVCNAVLYANGESVPLMSIHEYMKTVATSGFLSQTTAGSTNVYIPNTQSDASKCFSAGYYDNEISKVVVTNGELTIGVRSDKAISEDWACYDNFRLYYLGDDISEIRQAALDQLKPYEDELAANPDPTLAKAIEEAKAIIAQETDTEAIANAISVVEEAYKYHVTAAVPETEAIDLTKQMLNNADLRDGTSGWTAALGTTDGSSQAWSAYVPNNGKALCSMEAYAGFSAVQMNSYSLTQNVPLNEGMYRLRGYAFYRNSQNAKSSLARLVAGDESVEVKTLSSVSNADIIPYLLPNAMHEASEAFGAGNYVNELIFTIDEARTVKLGYEGTHEGAMGWFICGPVTLEKISESVLSAEAQAKVEAAKAFYNERKAIYTSIASQHTPQGAIFDTSKADAMAEGASTAEEAETAVDVLGTSLVAYMNECEMKDVFDLTALIKNPGFETKDPVSWTYSSEEANEMGIKGNSGVYSMSGSKGTGVFNSWITSNTTAYEHYVLQKVSHLPAGEFTLTAIVGGDQGDAAMRVVAGEESTDYIRCTDQTVGLKAKLDFVNETPGDVRIGVKSNRWFKCDEFHLSYTPLHVDDWMARDFTVNIENDHVKDFLAKANYPNSAAASVVATYATGVSDRPRGAKIYIPHSETVPSALTLHVSDKEDYSGTDTNTRSVSLSPTASLYTLYNTTPGITYYYKVEADGTIVTQGTFTTEGTVRMIYTNKGSNIRDLGGRKTIDNKLVRYGRLYRGGEMHAGGQTTMTADDLAEMKRLGIGAEVDLRCQSQTYNSIPSASALSGATYIYLDQSNFGSDEFDSTDGRLRYQKAFQFIANNMRNDKNVYFHCIWGADRTGALAMLLEGVMGWTLDDMYKDYEMTSFSKAGMRTKDGLDGKIAYVELNNKGKNLQEKIVDFLTSTCKVPQADIDAIRDFMLEDDPTSIEIIEAGKKSSHEGVFDLMGRKVVNPTHGIYIVNGKKVVK